MSFDKEVAKARLVSLPIRDIRIQMLPPDYKFEFVQGRVEVCISRAEYSNMPGRPVYYLAVLRSNFFDVAGREATLQTLCELLGVPDKLKEALERNTATNFVVWDSEKVQKRLKK